MSKTKRIWNLISANLMINAALFLMIIPEYAFELIAVFLGLYLSFKGAKYLLYYITHAQHMVGGKRLLLVGIILFDLGVFATTLYDQARYIMVIYVIGAHFIGAVLNFARAFSNKKDGNTGWKIDLMQGIGNIAQVALCLIFINYVEIPVFIYCGGVIYSAVLKIVSSFKRTAIVYVQ